MPSIHPDAEYFAFLKEGRFMLQQSASTKRTVFFPRLFEPGTGTSDLNWVPADGRGTVYATTRVRQRAPVPDYNVALIELIEGVRLISRVDGIAPEAVQIGMPVLARIIEENGEPLLVFVPAATERDDAGRTARPSDRGAPR